MLRTGLLRHVNVTVNNYFATHKLFSKSFKHVGTGKSHDFIKTLIYIFLLKQ